MTDTNFIETLIETYLNGNLSTVRDAIAKCPWLQTEIYIALPSDAKDLFMERCRAWHNAAYEYHNLNPKTIKTGN